MNPLAVSTIHEIDALAKDYAERRELLSTRVQALSDEIEAARRKRLPGIKSAVAEAAFAKSVLEQAILAHPELFVQPRTMTLHGIKVGLQKGKGSITCVDEQEVIKRVERLMPDQASTMIKITKKLVKAALKTLDVATCKKLGLIVTNTTDEVVITSSDTEVDKLVGKLLEEGSQTESDAA